MKEPRKFLKRLAARLKVLKRIHHDERGGVSIETVLIIAAIALPILIFLIATTRLGPTGEKRPPVRRMRLFFSGYMLSSFFWGAALVDHQVIAGEKSDQ